MSALLIIDELMYTFHIEISIPTSSRYNFTKIRLSSIPEIKKSNEWTARLQQQFAEDSFVIITNDIPDLQRLIQTAEETAVQFFENTDQSEKEKLRGEVELGYLRTSAKEGYHVKLVNELCPSHHPWPSETQECNFNFKDTMTATFQSMESICIDLVDILSRNGAVNGILDNIQDDLRRFEAIGKPMRKDKIVSSSLLSLFHYENSQETMDRTNCMEHIDQGFVSMEPHSAVSGLEIFMKKQAEWIRIDEPQYMNSNDLILFCSETLHRISDGRYQGTLHRVGKNNKSRLSMVYKMRHRDITKDMELHFGKEENYAFYQYDQNGNLVRITADDF